MTLSLGGIGVMNIMLVTVSERTREIGFARLSARDAARILMDFLAEGVCSRSSAASSAGALPWGFPAHVKLVHMPAMFAGLPVSGAPRLAFAALSVIAVASAFWPAWRAASLTPVEARYERRTMRLKQRLAEAAAALRFNRQRSILTIASLGWGVACFVILYAYGEGFGVALRTSFEPLGRIWSSCSPARRRRRPAVSGPAASNRPRAETPDRSAKPSPR